MRNVALILVILIVPGLVHAGPVMVTEIENIRVRPSIAYVKLKDCIKYNRIYLDSDYKKAMFSSALAAASANQQVRVEFLDESGCQSIESEFVYFEVIF